MISVPEALGWFLLAAVPIVVLTACVTHADDRIVAREFPRRYAVFVVSCALLAAAVWACGALFVRPG